LRYALHPRAGEGHQLTQPEEPEVPVAERRQRLTDSRPIRKEPAEPRAGARRLLVDA
jgi:hypothetical protein